MNESPLPPTVELLLRCARTDAATNDNAQRMRSLLGRGVDGSTLFQMAQWQRVVPLVWSALSTVAPDALNGKVRSQFEAEAKANALRCLYLTRRLVQLVQMLEANAVPALAYKGPALAVQVYGQPLLRQFSDLDLIVRPEHLAHARALLLADGFCQTWPAAALSPSQDARHQRAKYNYALRQPKDQLELELHWSLTPGYLRIPPAPSRLWDNLTTLDLTGQRLLAFSPERLLVILCVHGANHCWLRLNWVCDVAELLRRNPDLDWPAVLNDARAWGCTRILNTGLILAHQLLEAELPLDVQPATAQDAGARRLAAQAARRLTAWPPVWLRPFEEPLYHLRMRERWSDRARYCLAMATPTVKDWSYLPLPDALAPLYYVVRPARLVLEHGFNLRREADQ